MLFGNQDNAVQQTVAAPVVEPDQNNGVNPLAVDPATGDSLPVAPPTSPEIADAPVEPSILDQGPQTQVPVPVAPEPVPVAPAPVPEPVAADPNPTTPFPSDPAPVPVPQPPAQAQDTSSQVPVPAPDPVPAAPAAAPAPAPAPIQDDRPDPDSLFSLKREVVTELGPLVDQLDQAPNDKYKTIMMLIQTTDNPSLLQHAYSLAQQIPDEKARAQALLDIVNEINYFTQQPQQ